MTQAALTDAADDVLSDASAKMWQQQTGSLLITEGDKLIGIVTERDVLRVIAEGHDPTKITLREVMTADPVTVPLSATVREAAGIMFDKWFRHLPVVADSGEVAGIISLRDLLSLVAQGMDEPTTLETLTGHRLTRDIRLERVEAGDLD